MTDNTICAQHDHTHGEPLPGASRIATPSPVRPGPGPGSSGPWPEASSRPGRSAKPPRHRSRQGSPSRGISASSR
jgi:hypothetical protein